MLLWRFLFVPTLLSVLVLIGSATFISYFAERERGHITELRTSLIEKTYLEIYHNFHNFLDELSDEERKYASIHKLIRDEFTRHPNTDINLLKTKYTDLLGYPVDLFVVGNDFIVKDTTFTPDLGLNFNEPFFAISKASFTWARDNNSVFVGKPNQEIVSRQYKLYSYSSLPDNQGFFEVAFIDPRMFERFNQITSTIQDIRYVTSAELLLSFPNGDFSSLTPVTLYHDAEISKNAALEAFNRKIDDDKIWFKKLLANKNNWIEQENSGDESTFYLSLGRFDLVAGYQYNYWMKLTTHLPEIRWLTQNSTWLAIVLSLTLIILLMAYAYWIKRSILTPLSSLGGAIVRGHHVDKEALDSPLAEISHAFNAHITRSQSLAEELVLDALTDELTGLHNRKAMATIYPRIQRIAKRTHHMIAMLFIDLDHFKDYNDNYGHLAGDHALQALAEVINEEFRRPTDLAVRLGGEEFLVFFEVNNFSEALVKSEALRFALEYKKIPHEKNQPYGVLTLSGGLLIINPANQEYKMESLLEQADHLLYEAKARGRNKIINDHDFVHSANKLRQESDK